MILIALYGNLAAGKTSVARHLEQEHGFFYVQLETPRMVEFEEVQRGLPRLTAANWRGAVVDSIQSDAQAEALHAAGGRIWYIVRPRRADPAVPGIVQRAGDRGILNLEGAFSDTRKHVDCVLQQLESRLTS